MTSFVDLDAAADDARFVVDVTAPLAADQTATVVTEAAARLGVPAATMQKLLNNRIGPVTKPVKASTAERVASILTRVGVEVAVREVEPEHEGVQTPPVPMRPDPEPAHADGDAPDVTRPLEAEMGAPDAVINDAAANPPIEADEAEGDTLPEEPAEGPVPDENPPPQQTFEGRETQPEPATDKTEPSEPGRSVESAPAQPASEVPAGRGTGTDWPDDWSTPEVHDQDDDFGAWNPPVVEPVRLEDDQAVPSTLVDDSPDTTRHSGQAASEVGSRQPAWFEGQAKDEADWQELNPFAEADRQDRITRRWALGLALVVALGVLVTLQWVYG